LSGTAAAFDFAKILLSLSRKAGWCQKWCRFEQFWHHFVQFSPPVTKMVLIQAISAPFCAFKGFRHHLVTIEKNGHNGQLSHLCLLS